MLRITSLVLFSLLLVSTGETRPRQVGAAHPDCIVVMPCEGVINSPRGEYIAKKLGFGGPQKVYAPRRNAMIVAHPPGCPARAFCGCGAAVRVFGRPVRDLWLAANWFKFPRTSPKPGAVAVRRHHVFVLEHHVAGDVWRVYDANSGGRKTRIHDRSIAGYTIVSPSGAG
jgi:hypothetical protein